MRTRLRTTTTGIVLALATTLGVLAVAPASAAGEFPGVGMGCADPVLAPFDSWEKHGRLDGYAETAWVPQGMTYDAERDHLYVSMYHKDQNRHPVVVVFQRDTTQRVRTIELTGLPGNAHVGGLTIGRGKLYVADSTGGGHIYQYPMDHLRGALGAYETVSWERRYRLPGTDKASYVTFHGGHLYVGNHDASTMYRHKTATNGVVETAPNATYSTPSEAQGVEVSADHFVFSRSPGRNQVSQLTTQVRSDVAPGRPTGVQWSHVTRPMMEGIVWAPESRGSSVKRLYAVFESTSTKFVDPAPTCRTHAIWSVHGAYVRSVNEKAPTPQAPAPPPTCAENDCWRAQLGSQAYEFTPNPSGDARLQRIIFDPRFYLDVYPDVRDWVRGKLATQGGTMHQHAQWHWLHYGVPQGRTGAATFDPAYYMAHHPDVASAYGSATHYEGAISHYVVHGRHEGRRASVFFDPAYYKGRYGDIAAFPNADALDHFTVYGMSEGRQGSADFAPAWYLGTYPDLRAAYGSNNYRTGMSHWLANGQHEGRMPRP